MLKRETELEEANRAPLLTPKGLGSAFVDRELAAEYLGQSMTLVNRMQWATRHTDEKWLEIIARQ